MATKMALLHVLLLVLASQWTSTHGRSMQGEYNTEMQADHYEELSNDDFGAQNNDAVTFATEWINSQTDSASFAKDSSTDAPTFDYTAADSTFADAGSDSASFSSQDVTNSQTEQSIEELPYDTFIESLEVVQDAGSSSFVDENLDMAQPKSGSEEPFDEAYANDEVFYDTSNADTVYNANDDRLSLAAAHLNESSADEMLASLAKAMGGCGTGNPIDDCWRCDRNWRSHRQALASCAIGFGRNAMGGKNGPIYVVTSNGDDTQNPQRGTLRYGVTRNGPLWIIFAKSMTIELKGELWVSAFKTIDARGAQVHIVGGSQITIQRTNNVIIHGLHIHDIRPSGPSLIRVSPSKLIRRGKSEGDAIHIWESRNVWIDHCYLAKATDGLIDVTRGSSMVTISNCFFENHNKVMLFGSNPTHTEDRNMRATVAFNKFGPGLTQRLPRCRFGVFHVLNNDYTSGWGIYAIGGSEDPTILSQGNLFRPAAKGEEVTKRINDKGPSYGGWQKWNWASSGDVFQNGAYFTGSGAKASSANAYAKAFSTSSRPGYLVPAITRSAGPLWV